MLNTLISLGLESVEKHAIKALTSRSRKIGPDPLGAYPKLHAALLRAERRGLLAAERRMLAERHSSN